MTLWFYYCYKIDTHVAGTRLHFFDILKQKGFISILLYAELEGYTQCSCFRFWFKENSHENITTGYSAIYHKKGRRLNPPPPSPPGQSMQESSSVKNSILTVSEINRTAAEFTQNGRKRKSMFGRQLCECHRVNYVYA